MLLGAGNNYLRLYQIDDIFSRERPIWQDESDGDDSWRYGQVSVSGVTEHQVKKALWILLWVLSNIRSHGGEDPPGMPDGKLLLETSKTISFQAFLVKIAQCLMGLSHSFAIHVGGLRSIRVIILLQMIHF